jgi:hypothetical protein
LFALDDCVPADGVVFVDFSLVLSEAANGIERGDFSEDSNYTQSETGSRMLKKEREKDVLERSILLEKCRSF